MDAFPGLSPAAIWALPLEEFEVLAYAADARARAAVERARQVRALEAQRRR